MLQQTDVVKITADIYETFVQLAIENADYLIIARCLNI